MSVPSKPSADASLAFMEFVPTASGTQLVHFAAKGKGSATLTKNRVYRLMSNEECSISFDESGDTAPGALFDGMRFAPDTPELFRTTNKKVVCSVVGGTTSGTLWITESFTFDRV